MTSYLLTLDVEHQDCHAVDSDGYVIEASWDATELPSIRAALVRLIKNVKDMNLRDALRFVTDHPTLSTARGRTTVRFLCDDAMLGRALIMVWDTAADDNQPVKITVDSIDTFRQGVLS